MERAITIELLKFKVPLSEIWKDAIDSLLEFEDRTLVEDLALKEAFKLERRFADSSLPEDCDKELLSEAREAAINTIQSRFSGKLPELVDRDTDLLSQHGSVWSLISQLVKKPVGRCSISESVQSLAVEVLSSQTGESWKHRAKNVVNMLSSLKGTTDDRIHSVCLGDAFLCERELVAPAVKLIVKGNEFKQLMSSPDMVNDGEKTLPKLLLSLANDKEFRQTFMWLPLDPENPLNTSGGSGVMPTDKKHYRFVLTIILKILFGKLRQRGHGIDKRISFAERQSQIMGYIGTVPISDMCVVFQVLFARVISENISVESLIPKWNGSEFVDAKSDIPILNRSFIESNPSVHAGVLQSMTHLISQMKRKADAFVPLLAVFVVSSLAWNIENNKSSKHALLRLAELMETYMHIGSSVWATLIEPIADVLKSHLSRSSAAEISTVFRIVTNWCHSEQLVGLYSHPVLGKSLLIELFKPRALTGSPATALFTMILTLCGEDADASSGPQSYMQSRNAQIREHKRTGGDMDSDDEDEEMGSSMSTVQESVSVGVVVDHIPSILSIVSQSLAKSADKTLALRVTVTIARLAADKNIELPEAACRQLLELISAQLKSISNLPPRKARMASKEACMLLEASSQVAALIPASVIPESLFPVVSRLVLTMDDVRGRTLLAECILELSKKVSESDILAAEKLVELNAIRRSGASLQPDVDRHVDILQEILDLADEKYLEYFLSSVLIIRHCLFLLSIPACDTTVRHCAERLLSQVGRVRDNQGRLPIPRLLMIVNQAHKLLESHSSEAGHRSALKLILFYVKEYSTEVEDEENSRLLHKDLLPFTAVLEDLQHIQRHRRSRALGRLAEGASQLTDYTKKKLLAPLAVEALVQPGVAKMAFDASLAETGIKTLQVCPGIVDLLIKLVKVHLRKTEDREKIILRAVSKIVEKLINQNRPMSDEEIARAQSVLVPQLRKRVFDKKSTLVGDQSDKHRLAREKGQDMNEGGLVKVEAVVALLEVLKFFCSKTLSDQTEQLVRIVLQGLPSRELINRRAARDALKRCAKVLGITRTAWLLKEIRHALPRGGFQAAVAVFTCYSVMEALEKQSVSVSTGTDIALEVLECLRVEDAQWAMTQSRSDGAVEEDVQIANQCVEAKRRKGHELLELSAKILPASVVTGVLLRSVYALFNTIEGVDIEELSSEEDSDVESEDSDSCSSEDEKVNQKRKRLISTKETPKRHRKPKAAEIQMNAVHQTKKYMVRIESALTCILQGIKDNSLYSEEDRLGLCVQAFALFDDIVSRKLRFDEDKLFVKNVLNRALLDMDKEEEADQKISKQSTIESFRQKQKEKTFLVQPGASTGKGHWVTEEWKRGKIGQSSSDAKSRQVSVMDIRAVKSKVLGSMGLSLLNGLSLQECPLDEEIKTGLAKFATRAFCSGITDLFQLSAKAVQKLLNLDESIFNEKAMILIAKRLMASMEQLHRSGSDLSFITLKQQKKIQSGEVASTCASLLLSLVSVDTEWLKADMLETLASHIRASLDKPALQPAALAMLKKLFFKQKSFKTATLYDCLNTVGELIVTATNPRVCGLSGILYAQFLVDFPHTERALGDKVMSLVKQATSASSAVSRCAALNTIHAFVRALPAKTLQDVFGEIIFVTLAVNAITEEDTNARSMVHKVLALVMEKMHDKVKRDRLVEVVQSWPSTMTKHQFVLGSAEVCSVLSQAGIVEPEKATEVVLSVIRQLPFLIVPESMESDQLAVKGQLAVVEAAGRLVETKPDLRIAEFVAVHLLKQSEPVFVPVVAGVLKFLLNVCAEEKAGSVLTEISEQDGVGLKILDDQVVESLAPWPTMMRVLHVLTRDTTESHLEIPSLAMKTIASLLPLCEGKPVGLTSRSKNEPVGSGEEVEVGLFAQTKAESKIVDDELVIPETRGDRLAALLKKVRYEVRRLMGKPRESIIRLASLLRLTAALTLAAPASEDEEILGTSLEILIRLATINKTAEEVSTEIGDVSSLFEMSILRPIEQIGCLSKMANGAIESLEKHFRNDAAFFTRMLTKTTAVINKGRKDRKISLLNLAVSNPARLAMLRLRKSKRKSEKRQERAKEDVKRIKRLIN